MPLPIPEQTPVVVPQNESRLDQLCAELAVIESQYTPLKERYDELREAIKQELASGLQLGQRDVQLRSPYLPLMRYHGVPTWRVNIKRMKAEEPALYVKYAKRSTTWKLEKVK